jgi:hypothetical protein
MIHAYPNMKKIIFIVAGLIFIAVTVLITINITKKIIEKETAGLTQAQKENLTSKDILNHVLGGRLNKAENIRQVTWAGFDFEISQFRDINYKSDGNIEWIENGFIAHDYSLPQSKLLNVNMNQKIKIKVIANMEGSLESDVPDCTTESCFFKHEYPFAEFAIYFVDSRDHGEIRYGIALIGTRDRIAAGHARDEFKFDWFSVENTGKQIIFEDSSGRRLVFDENSNTYHNLSDLNQDDEWRLRINSHVNGKGYTKLEIKEIQVVK